MCGICGVFNFNFQPVGSREIMATEAMVATMRHRGPDSQGLFHEGPLVLGAARLAIQDLDPAANQPLHYQDQGQRLVTVFNGEVYNFVELRSELEREGARFVTRSDTEVLAALFARHGPACLSRLKGMFALAVWNHEAGSLFLARDRIGEKPLVYHQNKNRLVFASDLPSLLASGLFTPEVDLIGVHLSLYFMVAPAPHSPFRGVKKLPPATQMILDHQGAQSEKYWHLDFTKDPALIEPNLCAAQVGSCLDQCVDRMWRSDVPVGVTLSGGLDSSAVAAAMTRAGRTFPAFRIGADTPKGQQEAASAKAVAQRYGLELDESLVEPRDLDKLRRIVRMHGEPVISSTSLDALLLSRRIKDRCTVALCGGGADELFGGYPEHYILPALLRAMGGQGEADMQGLYEQLGCPAPERLLARLKYALGRPALSHAYGLDLRRAKEEALPEDLLEQAYAESGAADPLDALMWQHLGLLCQYSLVDIYDRTGMAHSLEYRSPFLDVDMLELAARIPTANKACLRGDLAGCKQTLRLAMEGRLPDLTLRAKRTPFGSTVPYESWFLRDHQDFVQERLASQALLDSGLFDHQKLDELGLLAACGADVPYEVILGPIMVGLWLEEFF